jgi:hypothetical protein
MSHKSARYSWHHFNMHAQQSTPREHQHTSINLYTQETNSPLSHHTTSRHKIALDLRQNNPPRRPTRRFHTEEVVGPPWARSPPKRSIPHIRILPHIAQPVLKRSDTLGVISPRKLPNHADLLVVLEPLRRSLQALLEDSPTDALGVCARAVAVEVLVHLVDELVLRIFEGTEGGAVAGGYPRPGAGPAVAFGRDVLRGGASGADAVDGGLVEVEDELLVHVVVPEYLLDHANCANASIFNILVICVEDDKLVVLELGGDILPPSLKAGGVGNDVGVEAAIVMRLDHSVGAFLGDIVHLFGEITKVVLVKGTGEGVGREALHSWCLSVSMTLRYLGGSLTKVQTEHVHALRNELVDRVEIVPDVFLAICAWVCCLAELGARLIDAEPLQLASLRKRT